jgi:hypothetical protein
MTKVSLRKAKALQNSLQDTITENGYAIDTDIQFTEFEDPIQKQKDHKNKFFDAMSKRTALLSAVFEIRKLVGAANSSTTINELLCDLAKLEKDITLYQALASTRPRLSYDVVVGMIEKIRNREEGTGRYSNSVDTTIFTDVEIQGFKTNLANLKKDKQKVQDQLLELNVRTEITLSQTVVDTLKVENIL